ncbi:SRPBCC domain-containing protein [Fulvivirgaceae bacterium BMA10]|uniref:SRPBCC domain-containing protein n=1 Tax=Splendidivirga corallicola TaxID=3051826 RepID=A0ABT8KQ62_9BACT|nr:SRPBCC domain-containing protein [Fulvivirgaceae bacterium BMA10]
METKITSMKKTEAPIIVEQLYNASPDEVWAAITERDQMIQWFFNNIPEFKAEVGFETQFMIEVEDRKFPHLWKVTEVIHGKKLTYQWRFGGYEGEGLSTFELFEQDGKTGVKLIYDVIEDFPDGIPEFVRESGEQGWRYFIQESLKNYLNG